jgi:hypothetical protein
MSDWTQFRWIHFEPKSVKAKNPILGGTDKADTWSCRNNHSGGELGIVAWYGPWRMFCFIPEDSLFSADCLRDIKDFLEALNARTSK